MTTQQVIISASPEQVDILLAELGEIHFDIFEDSDTGLIAYCQTDLFDPALFSEVITRYEVLGPISFEINEIEKQNWNAVWESNYDPWDKEESFELGQSDSILGGSDARLPLFRRRRASHLVVSGIPLHLLVVALFRGCRIGGFRLQLELLSGQQIGTIGVNRIAFGVLGFEHLARLRVAEQHECRNEHEELFHSDGLHGHDHQSSRGRTGAASGATELA